MISLLTQKLDTARRHYQRVVAFAVLGAVIGGVLMYVMLPQLSVAPTVPVVDTSTTTSADSELVAAEPARLRIPSVGIDTAFAGPLGVNDDQTVEVPEAYDAVGWYQYGPKPGELGPAVVLGHVDSYQGPAVFWPLRQVSVGDKIEVERADGSVAVFVVTKRQEHQQAGFPTAQVYGDIDHAGLRLITCSGTFDRGRQVYSHNLIVYAKMSNVIPADSL